jgi:uncharacterized damage-inducible protein DinB
MIEDFRSEFERYRIIAEKALAQIPDSALDTVLAPDGNSAAMIVRHMSGNLVSRFTNFLTEDGEKPSRDRDSEFADRTYDRAEMDAMWKKGWSVVENTVANLSDEDLRRTVTIREQPLTVHAALARAISHQAYHAGQLVLIARITADAGWKWISIPKGQSDAYNAAPDREKKPR